MPANFCGITSLKPTAGRLPLSGQESDGGLVNAVEKISLNQKMSFFSGGCRWPVQHFGLHVPQRPRRIRLHEGDAGWGRAGEGGGGSGRREVCPAAVEGRGGRKRQEAQDWMVLQRKVGGFLQCWYLSHFMPPQLLLHLIDVLIVILLFHCSYFSAAAAHVTVAVFAVPSALSVVFLLWEMIFFPAMWYTYCRCYWPLFLIFLKSIKFNRYCVSQVRL